MKITFDGGGGQGRLTAGTMENGKAAECFTAAAKDNDKAIGKQDLEAAQTKKSKRQMQCQRTRPSKINRWRYRRMGVGGQQAKRRKAGL
jgi:hypothetical protein